MKAQAILLVAAFLKGIQADKNPLSDDRPIFLNPDFSAEELEYLSKHKVDNDVAEAVLPAANFDRGLPTKPVPSYEQAEKAFELLREQDRERERQKKKCSECSECPCKCDGHGHHTWYSTWTHTGEPTGHPTGTETDTKTGIPTTHPTDSNTGNPTGTPTDTQTGEPTGTQTDTHTDQPTGTHTDQPTGTQTDTQTGEPTGTQTGEPTGTQTGEPTGTQTGEPTGTQTGEPTGTQTGEPTGTQTNQPTGTQTDQPTGTQTDQPTDSATMQPEVYTCTRVRPCENVCTHTHHKPHLPIPTEVPTHVLPTYLSPKVPHVPGPAGPKRSHPPNHNLTARHECTLSNPCNKPCHHTAAVPPPCGMETKIIPDVAPTGVVPVRGNDTCGDNCPAHVPVSGGVETAAISGVALLAVAAVGFLL